MQIFTSTAGAGSLSPKRDRDASRLNSSKWESKPNSSTSRSSNGGGVGEIKLKSVFETYHSNSPLRKNTTLENIQISKHLSRGEDVKNKFRSEIVGSLAKGSHRGKESADRTVNNIGRSRSQSTYQSNQSSSRSSSRSKPITSTHANNNTLGGSAVGTGMSPSPDIDDLDLGDNGNGDDNDELRGGSTGNTGNNGNTGNTGNTGSTNTNTNVIKIKTRKPLFIQSSSTSSSSSSSPGIKNSLGSPDSDSPKKEGKGENKGEGVGVGVISKDGILDYFEYKHSSRLSNISHTQKISGNGKEGLGIKSQSVDKTAPSYVHT